MSHQITDAVFGPVRQTPSCWKTENTIAFKLFHHSYKCFCVLLTDEMNPEINDYHRSMYLELLKHKGIIEAQISNKVYAYFLATWFDDMNYSDYDGVFTASDWAHFEEDLANAPNFKHVDDLQKYIKSGNLYIDPSPTKYDACLLLNQSWDDYGIGVGFKGNKIKYISVQTDFI